MYIKSAKLYNIHVVGVSRHSWFYIVNNGRAVVSKPLFTVSLTVYKLFGKDKKTYYTLWKLMWKKACTTLCWYLKKKNLWTFQGFSWYKNRINYFKQSCLSKVLTVKHSRFKSLSINKKSHKIILITYLSDTCKDDCGDAWMLHIVALI